MFRSKTVFVVGAGASCELDLPSGNDLKRFIAEALNIQYETFGGQKSGDGRIAQALHQHVGGQLANINGHLTKAWRIRDAMPAAMSIDNYLDAHQGDGELELCGKLAIVKCILDAERRSKLRSTEQYRDKFDPNSASDTWLLRFLRSLAEGVRRTDVESIFDNVSVIVFNYDRCIERYLVPALAGYYNLSEDESISVVKRLRIYHPYGQVGPLPWQGGETVTFGSSDQANLLAIAAGIKTFTEGQDDEDVMKPILEIMSEAETLVFLGFAYHQQNLDLISPEKMQVGRTIGTSRGISGNDTMAIVDSLQSMFGYKWVHPSMAEARHNIHLHGATCAGLFDEYSRSLTSALR